MMRGENCGWRLETIKNLFSSCKENSKRQGARAEVGKEKRSTNRMKHGVHPSEGENKDPARESDEAGRKGAISEQQ